ncbi:hypothetical protein GCM10009609_03940 [Pseudonocardia aurantiaca]
MCEPRCGFQTGWPSGTEPDGVRSLLADDETKLSGEGVIAGCSWVWADQRGPAHAKNPRRGAGRSDPAAAAKEQAHHVPEGNPMPGDLRKPPLARPTEHVTRTGGTRGKGAQRSTVTLWLSSISGGHQWQWGARHAGASTPSGTSCGSWGC